MADFQFNIVHVKGKFMIPADTLSRLIRRDDEEAEGGGKWPSLIPRGKMCLLKA